jgi:DNA polymerase-3 subunit gamma/tau
MPSMSYTVLARKYRPKHFGQMVGQPHVVQALSNALLQQRLHHAYLFTGTRGIGKTTISRILAKSLNCTGADGQGGITATPCGVCDACTAIDADRYIDYIEMDAASTGGKDDIRDLIERAAYKPSIGRFKVFMIDECHQLSKDAFNALLKTLEEPPPYLKFILATTDPEKVLPTVLSRCLQFNLRPMAPQTVCEHLEQVLQAETIPHDAASLSLLGRAARGSMRDALSLTDQAIAYGSGRIEESGVRAMLGLADDGFAERIVAALAKRDGRAVLAQIDALREAGATPAALLESLAQLLQRMAVEQAVPGALGASEQALPARRLAAVLPADETQLLYSMALHGREELALASDAFGALTMVLLRLLAFPSSAGPRPASPDLPPTGEAPQAQPQPNAAALAAAPAPPAPPARAAQPLALVQTMVASAALPRPMPGRHAVQPEVAPVLESAPEPVPEPARSSRLAAESDAASTRASAPPALADTWNELVRRMSEAGAVQGLVRELAWQSVLTHTEPGAGVPQWQLCVEQESLRTAALRDRLAEALAGECGIRVQLQLGEGRPSSTPAQREAAHQAQRQAQAEAAVQADPLVREMLATFKTARIVPGSVKPLNG